MLTSSSLTNRYNREAKKAIAVITGGDLYRLAKSRHERTQDIEHFCYVNDKNDILLIDRRREYFEQISTEEFVYPPLLQSLPAFGAVPAGASEVKEKRMKSGKTPEPDDIASELCKANSWDLTRWFSEFFNRAIQESRTPSDWQESITMKKER